MKEFINFTEELNEYAKNYKLDTEIITNEDLLLAIYYLNNLYIEEVGDILTYLSALNLCNAYVKQENNLISYRFKKGIGKIIKILNETNISNIKICQVNDKGNLYIFKIGNIQFTFHDEKKLEINNIYYEDMSWDNIRKQPCSKTLFKRCINNNICTKNKTIRNENIKEKSIELLEYYHHNKIDINNIINNI